MSLIAGHRLLESFSLQFLRLPARCLLSSGNPDIWWLTLSLSNHHNDDDDDDDDYHYYHYDYYDDYHYYYYYDNHPEHHDNPRTCQWRVGRLGPLEWVFCELRGRTEDQV